ncbi:hypothetical protein HYQ46_009493 [Verticillium longisporum]|nr:hypothetical protein HYQ46_009493 [Verticillium longisporum]
MGAVASDKVRVVQRGRPRGGVCWLHEVFVDLTGSLAELHAKLGAVYGFGVQLLLGPLVCLDPARVGCRLTVETDGHGNTASRPEATTLAVAGAPSAAGLADGEKLAVVEAHEGETLPHPLRDATITPPLEVVEFRLVR